MIDNTNIITADEAELLTTETTTTENTTTITYNQLDESLKSMLWSADIIPTVQRNKNLLMLKAGSYSTQGNTNEIVVDANKNIIINRTAPGTTAKHVRIPLEFPIIIEANKNYTLSIQNIAGSLNNGSSYISLLDKDGNEIKDSNDKIALVNTPMTSAGITSVSKTFTSVELEIAYVNVAFASDSTFQNFSCNVQLENYNMMTSFEVPARKSISTPITSNSYIYENITETLSREPNYYYKYDTGERIEYNNANNVYTVRLKVKPGDKFKVTSNYGYDLPLAVFFDFYGNYLGYYKHNPGSSVPAEKEEVIIPDGCYSVAFSTIASATSNANLIIYKKIMISKAPTNKPSLFVAGDSIAYGDGSDGYAYGEFLRDKYGMNLTKSAVCGATITYNDRNRFDNILSTKPGYYSCEDGKLINNSDVKNVYIDLYLYSNIWENKFYITAKIGGNLALATFFDKDGNYLRHYYKTDEQSVTLTEAEVNIPNDCRYVSFASYNEVPLEIYGYRKDYIYNQIQTMEGDYDYILIEGGINDASLSIPLGSITDRYDGKYDTSTVIGTLEQMCYFLTINFFESKKLYILTHSTFNSEDPRIKYNQNTYFDAIISVLDKWAIPYVDLRKQTGLSAINNELRIKYFKDDSELAIHPLKHTYEKFYLPAIEAKLYQL